MQTQPPFQPCRSRSSTKSQSSMRQLGECAWTGPGGLLAATPDRARQNQRPDAKSGGTLQVAGILRCLRRASGLARLAKWTPRLSRRRITTSGNKSVMGRVELHAAKIPSLQESLLITIGCWYFMLLKAACIKNVIDGKFGNAPTRTRPAGGIFTRTC